MIIKFDFDSQSLANISKNLLSAVFSEVSRSSLMGYHRIVLSRSLSKWVFDNLDLSNRDKHHILKIGQEFSQLGGQYLDAKYKIIVCSSVSHWSFDGIGVWTIGLNQVLPGGYLSQSYLVLENSKNDGGFYDLIFSWTAKRAQLSDLSYEVVHGGGNGSANVIRSISQMGRMVSCICDTDLKAKGGAYSTTHNSVMAVRGNANLIGKIVGTPAREIENFLPISIVKQLTENQDSIDFIENLMLNQIGDVEEGDCIWLYIDIKEGFSAGVLDSYGKSQDIREWICRKFNVSDCDIKNISISPLGENILSQFMRSDHLKSEMHKYIRSSYWDIHFFNWVCDILWFFLGRKRERVI